MLCLAKAHVSNTSTNRGRVQTALGVTCNVAMACVAEEARPPHFTVTYDVHVWLGATMREWEERRECAGRDAHRVCAEGAGEGLMASEGAEGGEPVLIRVPVSADTEIAESGASDRWHRPDPHPRSCTPRRRTWKTS